MTGPDPTQLLVLDEAEAEAGRALADGEIERWSLVRCSATETRPTDRAVVFVRGNDGHHAAGVLVGKFHRAKGLESKEVFAFGLGAAQWPAPGLHVFLCAGITGPPERDVQEESIRGGAT